MTCSYPRCFMDSLNTPLDGKNYCSYHYDRVRRAATPLDILRFSRVRRREALKK